MKEGGTAAKGCEEEEEEEANDVKVNAPGEEEAVPLSEAEGPGKQWQQKMIEMAKTKKKKKEQRGQCNLTPPNMQKMQKKAQNATSKVIPLQTLMLH